MERTPRALQDISLLVDPAWSIQGLKTSKDDTKKASLELYKCTLSHLQVTCQGFSGALLALLQPPE